MKINVEVDCTPLEAREFLGLPDVKPMQAAITEAAGQHGGERESLTRS